MSAHGSRCRREVLATLGENLVICRLGASGSEQSLGRFEVGAFDGEAILVIDTDAQGRSRRAENFGDSRLGYFLKDGKQYQIIGQLGRGDRNKPDDLKRVAVRAREGRMVTLDNLIRYEEGISPASIYRFNRNVSATISGEWP